MRFMGFMGSMGFMESMGWDGNQDLGSKAGIGKLGSRNGMEHPERDQDVGTDSQEKEG